MGEGSPSYVEPGGSWRPLWLVAGVLGLLVVLDAALPYLDIVARVADAVDVPVSAYQVSGEYAMLEAAAANGWVDRQRAVLETLTAIRRAGAGTVLTYWAVEAARWLR